MNPTASDRLPTAWDTRHCELSPMVRQKLEEGLEPVARLIRDFPVSNLHIQLEHFPRTNRWRVKTSLALTGETLVSLGEGDFLNPTFENCIANLFPDAHAYKARLRRVHAASREETGTH